MGLFGWNKNEEGASIGLTLKKGYTYFLMQGGYVARTLTSSISRTPPFFSGQKDLAGHAGTEMVAQTDVTPAKGFHYFVNRNGNVTRLAAPATISDFESTYTNLSKEEKLSIAVSVTGVDDHEQVGTNYSGKDLFDFLVMKLKEQDKQRKIANAQDKEEHLDYDGAIVAYEEIGDKKSAKRVRKLKAEQASVKVDQTVVHGDYVDDRDTIIKDSVINRSSIGVGGDDKLGKIKELKELLDSGAISEEDYQKMKREIVG